MTKILRLKTRADIERNSSDDLDAEIREGKLYDLAREYGVNTNYTYDMIR